MPEPPHPSSEDGTRDCGRFFLDLVGCFSRGDLDVDWSDEQRPSNEQVDRLIDETWRNELAEAQKIERELFDGPLCRLIDWRADQGRLGLTLGPVGYREFFGTNATQAHIRYLHGPEVLADAVGVSAAVTTADGFILLGQRSPQVTQYTGRLHPVGGGLMPSPDADAPPDPFATILSELTEEVAIDAQSLTELVCIGLVRDKHTVQPELIFDATVDTDVVTLLQEASHAADAHEHTAFVPVRNHPAAVVTFIEQHFSQLTPVALATLLLHGQRHWGSGWFAGARGYLCSVI
jgi:hypothetical protein